MFNELMRSTIHEAQLQDEREAANEPRQAYVTRSEGNGVWVRFGTEGATAPESWFVSTVVGVPPGTMGWVYPLAGGKGLFVVTAIWQPIPIDFWSGSAVNTTSLTTPAMLIDESVTLPPGTWEFRVLFSAMLWRSVATGSRRMHCILDDVDTPLSNAVAPVPLNSAFQVRYLQVATVNVTEERSVPIAIGVSGGETAGTTNIGYGTITGQAIRIGGPT